jgi:hypothetical protein
MKPDWTKEEIEILKENYSTKGKIYTSKLLPNRTISAIDSKVTEFSLKLLPEARKKYSSWTTKYDELKLLNFECELCGKIFTPTSFAQKYCSISCRNKSYYSTKVGWDKMHEYRLSYRKNLRLKAIEKLGGKCSNPECHVPGGETDFRCLQIDHINGGGNREYKNIGCTGVYRKIIRGQTNEYQVLCASCNLIKCIENKERYKRYET